MNYGSINKMDIINGEGIRVSLFVSGCSHHCLGCFNEETWDFNYGQEYTQEEEDLIIEAMKNPYIEGLTILGGEPLEPENVPEVKKLVERTKKELPNKTIWIYSGFIYEKLVEKAKSDKNLDYILNNIDVLVDGPFVLSKKDLSLKFRGSSNQRILQLKKDEQDI